MKKLFIAALLACLPILDSFSQQPEKEVVVIAASKFVVPLVEKWISVFSAEHPELTVQLAPKGFAGKVSLYINGDPAERAGFQSVAINRFALLPIANVHNKHVKEYLEKGIKEKQLSKLFFSKYDPFATSEQVNQQRKKLDIEVKHVNLYTSLQKSDVSLAFAASYGFTGKDILGKEINGDEKFLVNAVQKDSNGVSYNQLGSLYDVQSRKLKEGLVILPLDLNNSGTLEEEEKIYGSLDAAVVALNSLSDKSIPVGIVRATFPKEIDKASATQVFVDWLLVNTNTYNQEFGFLTITKEESTKPEPK